MLRSLLLFADVFRLNRIVLVALAASAATAIGQAKNIEMPKSCSAYASVPLPSESDRVSVPTAFPGCASYRSYRGIGRPVDYSAARKCAWQERLAQRADLPQNPAEPTAWFVGGSLILADIYLNGDGVQRNVPLAMRLACESEPGMVELALPNIEKREGQQRGHGSIELCDYADSTFAMNFCASYENEIEDDRRSRYYQSLKASMDSQQQEAFGKLLAAQKAYVDAHAFEVDQGGTIRGIRTMGSQAILNDLFRVELVHYERKRWPSFTDEQIRRADPELHREYEKKLAQLSKQTEDNINEGGVSATHLASVEQTWERYRDAWVAFARLRYPSAASAIRAEITLDRYRFLKTIISYE